MIENIGIIGGRGMMGQMFQPAWEELGCTIRVTGSKDHHLEKALVMESDLVIVSVPIDKTPEVIQRISPWLKPGQLLSDFASVKNRVVPELMKTQADVISVHPMFGRVTSLTGHKVIMLPQRPGKWQHKYERMFKQLGLETVTLQDWKQHDHMMSLIQGLTHFIHITFSQALSKTGVDLDTLLSICSPVYEANFAFACRILQRDPSLYTHILMDNQENQQVIRHFIDEAQHSLKLVEHGEEEKFIEQFEKTRDFLGESGKQFAEESDYLIEKLKEYQARH